MSDDIINGLTSVWLGSQSYNLAMFETYYYGQQAADGARSMLTSTQAAQADITRFWRPVNYVATVIDEPIGYLAGGRIRITSLNERAQAWGESFFQRRIRPRLDDTIRWQGLYGEAYLYFWTDYEGASRGLKVDSIAPIEAGTRRVLADYGGEDPEELTAAVIYKRIPVDSKGALDEYRITISPDRITVEKRRIQGNVGIGGGGTWTLERDEANPAGVLPLIPVFNPVPSDILDFLPIQDDLDKLHLDMRLSREYHGLPLLTTDAPQIPNDLQVGSGRVLYGGNFQRLDPPDIEPLLAERKALLEDGASIVKSLALANRAGSGEISGVALRFLQQNFESRLTAKAERLSSAMELALTTAARITSQDARLLKLESRGLEQAVTANDLTDPEFSVTWEPVIPADGKANAEVAAILLNQLGSSQETALGKAGIEEPAKEIERAQKERDAEMGMPPVEAGDAGDA